MPPWISTLPPLLETAPAAVLVTVAATESSAPRARGARMVVSAAHSHGSVGGGRLEQRAIEIARAMLAASAAAPRLERFTLGASLGQCCGGVMVLAFERIGPARPDWVERAANLAAGGQAWGRHVRLDGPHAGEVTVFEAGSVEQACAHPALATHARRLLAAGEEDACLLPARHGSGSGGEPAILLDVSPPPALQVVMFGAGHVGRALAELFGRLPLRVRWIDERAEVFPPATAPNIEPRCTDTPTAEVREAPADAVFLVLTHSHALDLELVEAILARDDFRFCGLIGSHTKRARFAHRLLARGHDTARVARLHCPIGLPGLRGKEPEVIALAIAAEVMGMRSPARSAPAAQFEFEPTRSRYTPRARRTTQNEL